MKLPAALARVNRVVTNPIQRVWAPRLAPWALVEHRGRTSGRRYTTPVLAWTTGQRIAIVLAYGRDSDWVHNTLADRGCGITRCGKHYRLVRPQILPADSPDIPLGARVFGTAFQWTLVGTLQPTSTPESAAASDADATRAPRIP